MSKTIALVSAVSAVWTVASCNCGATLDTPLKLLDWSPSALTMKTSVGGSVTGTVTLTNNGRVPIGITSVSVEAASREVFSTTDLQTTLAAGSSVDVNATYSPDSCPPPSAGADEAQLTFRTTAANANDLVIPLIGVCFDETPLDAGVDAGIQEMDAGRPQPSICPVPTVSAALSGLRWESGCANVNGCSCPTPPPQTQSTVLDGPAGTQFQVTLHFRGEVEQKTYVGGTSDGGFWLVGGARNGDPYNVYELMISSPPQTYFLNSGRSNQCFTFPVDLVETIPIDSGATLTLVADPIDGLQIPNISVDGGEVLVPGVPPYPEPFNGQFIQMDVVSVTPPALPDAGVSCEVAHGGCDPHASCLDLDAGVVSCQCPPELPGDGCSCVADARDSGI